MEPRTKSASNPRRNESSMFFPKDIFQRVTRAILTLESAPRGRNSKKMRGVAAYRLRVGKYRVLYTIDDLSHTVEVYTVEHRKDVYRR